jgi:hypothetical protein
MIRWLAAAFRYLLMSSAERYLGGMLLIGAISSDDCGWCDGGYNWLMGLSDQLFTAEP